MGDGYVALVLTDMLNLVVADKVVSLSKDAWTTVQELYDLDKKMKSSIEMDAM
jgi:hypothetical protein